MKTRTVKISVLTFFIISFIMLFSLYSLAAGNFLIGDADMDGLITASDARIALRVTVGLGTYSKAERTLCDANEDGSVSSDDARTIIRVSVNLEALEKEVFISDEDLQNELLMGEQGNIPAPEINAVPGSFTFTVYGNGHGVGMSQWGAVNLNKSGYTYEAILSRYYSGSRLVTAEEYPAQTTYPTLGEIDTQQLVARIVYNEIYGITLGGRYSEAVKAQAVAVFTLLKYYDFSISSRGNVGIATGYSYEELPADLKAAVGEVIGQYIAEADNDRPVLSVYSAMAAGKTASAYDIWGTAQPSLISVESFGETQLPYFTSTVVFSQEELRAMISQYSPDIQLSANPAEWIEIIEHTASIDINRGYVTKIRVGNRLLSGYNQFYVSLLKSSLRSSCFIVSYTP